MELISVIVPVYNVEAYLMRCVDSIRKQTYQNLEIILVDDGSPDGCPALCEEIRAMDSRIKVVHKENGGLGYARNSGLEVTTGTYVTFIDSDDWIHETHIENLWREAARTHADVVLGAHTAVLTDGSMHSKPIGLPLAIFEGADITERILLPLIGADVTDTRDVPLSSSSCMNLYRVDLIRQYDLRFRSERVAVAEDLYFNIDYFAHAQRVAVSGETGYYYFENPASISRRYDPKRFDRTICFYQVLQEQIQQYGLEKLVSRRAERSFLMKIRVLLMLLVRAGLPRKETFREIRRILNHPLVKKILSDYPVDAYIPAMRLLVKCMRAGNAAGVYWLVKVREYAKKANWMKALLKRIGIGK